MCLNLNIHPIILNLILFIILVLLAIDVIAIINIFSSLYLHFKLMHGIKKLAEKIVESRVIVKFMHDKTKHTYIPYLVSRKTGNKFYVGSRLKFETVQDCLKRNEIYMRVLHAKGSF